MASPRDVTPNLQPSAATEQPRVKPRTIGLLALCFFALGVGIVTSVGAAVLRALIAVIHNLFFLGKFSLDFDANVFDPPNPWGVFIILAPILGGLVVVWLVRNFAPEAKGHGVPEVMDAIYYKNGRIRMAVIFVKSLASAISIGSGASVGREGPIIQIGSGIGSAIGQFVRLPTWQTITLVAAGAGAGIAATFNTPLGGLMFAIELMLPEVSSRTFLPVVIATGAATYFGWLFFGYLPAFMVPFTALPEMSFRSSVQVLPVYMVLGLFCGVAAAAFVRLLYWMEDAFDDMIANAYLRSIVGMFGIGLMLYLMERFVGHAHVGGVGYATIQAVLSGEINVAWLLVLLFFAKLLATTVSMGAGASGGVFAPSLFLGATLGGALGAVISAVLPGLGVSSAMMAIIGMAAVVGSSTGAAMTAILMIFEMTQDYQAVVPAIIAVAIALGVRRVLVFENIYTMKLARRGHHIPKDRHSHMFMIRQAKDLMLPVRGIVPLAELEGARKAATAHDPGFIVATSGRRIAGLVSEQALASEKEPEVQRGFIIVRSDDFLRDVMERMGRKRHKVQLAIVVDRRSGVPRAEDVLGVLTREAMADRIIDDLTK